MKREVVHCAGCNTKLFDGKVIKGVSVISILPESESKGLCKRCKTWVPLPIVYSAEVPVMPID